MAKADAMRKLKKIAKVKQAMIDAVRHGALMYANGKGGRPIVDQHFTAGNQQRYGWQPLSRAYFMWKQGLLKAPKAPRLNKSARHAIASVKTHRAVGLRQLKKKQNAYRKSNAAGIGSVEIAREIDQYNQRTRQAVNEITKRVTPRQPERPVAAKGVKLDKNAGFQSDLGNGMRGEGRGKNLPMLVLTGELRAKTNSKTHTVSMRGGDAVIHFRNLPEYAVYHHEGSPPLPQRSPVKPNEQDRAQVIEHMKAYIRRATGSQPNKRTI